MPSLPSQAHIPRSTAVKPPGCSHWALPFTGKVVMYPSLSTCQVCASDLSRQVCHKHPQIFWQKYLESCNLPHYFLFCSKKFIRNGMKNGDPVWWSSYGMKQARVLINQVQEPGQKLLMFWLLLQWYLETFQWIRNLGKAVISSWPKEVCRSNVLRWDSFVSHQNHVFQLRESEGKDTNSC